MGGVISFSGTVVMTRSLIFAGTILLAGGILSCSSSEGGMPCKSRSDCPEGYFCDLSRNRCSPALTDAGEHDADGGAGDPAADGDGFWADSLEDDAGRCTSDIECAEPEDWQKYCAVRGQNTCEWIFSTCCNGEWACPLSATSLVPPDRFEEWAWNCGIYHCDNWQIPEGPGPDWQEERPYLPPDPSQLTGEWKLLVDNQTIVPPGCERDSSRCGIIYTAVINPKNPDVLYLGHYSAATPWCVTGIYKSVDGGNSWFSAWAGLGSAGCECASEYCEGCIYGPSSIFRLFIDPDEPKILIASTLERGFYRTENGGRNWEHIEDLAYRSDIYTGPVAKSSAGVYHAGCQDQDLISYDKGRTWVEGAFLSRAWRWINTYAADKHRPSRIWAGTGNTPYYTPPEDSFLFLSDDDGQSWSEMGQDIGRECGGRGSVSSIAICDADPEQMAVQVMDCGLFFSDDGGATWKINITPEGNLSSEYAGYEPLKDRCRLYIEGGRKAYYTEDQGRTWTEIFIKPLVRIFFNPYATQMIYGLSWTSQTELWVRE